MVRVWQRDVGPVHAAEDGAHLLEIAAFQRVEGPREMRFPDGVLAVLGHGSRRPAYSFSSRSSASRFARLVVRRIPCASLRLLAAWVSMIACLISSTALGWTLNSMSPMPRRRRV